MSAVPTCARALVARLSGPGFFRFALASMVALHHATTVAVGGAAVLVFFVLSGFWVTRMWSTSYLRTRAPYATFLISRFWRLAPVFALCSGLAWLSLAAAGAVPVEIGSPLRQIVSNLAMFGYKSLAFQANLPGWSLDIEMQYYLVAPVVAFAVMKRLEIGFALCLGVAVLGNALNATGLVAPYLPFFAIGAAAATARWRPAPPLAAASLIGALALILGLCASPFKDVVLGGPQAGPLHAYNGLFGMGLALSLVPFALYTTGGPSDAADERCGDLSYILYLTHYPMLLLAARYFSSGFGPPAALGAALLLSLLIWRFVDRPLNRARRRWVAGRRVAMPSEGSSVPPHANLASGDQSG